MPAMRATLLLGPSVPVPAPLFLTENLENVKVSLCDTGRSGFEITFRAGRAGPAGLSEFRLLASPLLKQGSRVIVMVAVNSRPAVLIDGLIKNQQLSPDPRPGATTLTVIGQDVAVAMDEEEATHEHPAQNEMLIAMKIIAKYARYGMIPVVIPPLSFDYPLPVERIPVQAKSTDLAYLDTLARRCGYVFHVKAGPVPGANTAYWGPPIRVGIPARALSVNMGGETNVESINFKYDAEAATTVRGEVKDRSLNMKLPVQTFFSTRLPPLAAFPAVPFDFPRVRTTKLKDSEGLTWVQAFARAQGVTDRSMDNVLTAEGEVDSARYGDVLTARSLVGVRGVGYQYDGFYHVKEVTHTLKEGEYKQKFTLCREGLGSTTRVVRP